MKPLFSAEAAPNCKHRSHYECRTCRKLVCARCGVELAESTADWKTGGYWCPRCSSGTDGP